MPSYREIKYVIESFIKLSRDIYHSILLQQPVCKVGPALSESCSDATAGSQLHCIGCILITCKWQIYIFATLLLQILKHSHTPDVLHMYLALFLGNSSCLFIPCLHTVLHKEEIWSSPYSCWGNGCREIGINQAQWRPFLDAMKWMVGTKYGIEYSK